MTISTGFGLAINCLFVESNNGSPCQMFINKRSILVLFLDLGAPLVYRLGRVFRFTLMQHLMGRKHTDYLTRFGAQ